MLNFIACCGVGMRLHGGRYHIFFITNNKIKYNDKIKFNNIKILHR